MSWLLLASAATLALTIAGAAPGGVGWAPPPAPGQVVGAYFPHRTGVNTDAVAEDSAGRIVVAGTLVVSSSLGGAVTPSATLSDVQSAVVAVADPIRFVNDCFENGPKPFRACDGAEDATETALLLAQVLDDRVAVGRIHAHLVPRISELGTVLPAPR